MRRLNSFDYFRAIAILFVVASHSYPPWCIDTLSEKIIVNLISGGTALFVFISGFFFHHIFFPKFHYREFLLKKSKNVLLPYIILSSIGFLVIVVLLHKPHPQVSGELNGITGSLILYLKFLWTGQIITAYWYIPFIMIVFAISPIFIKFINVSRKKQLTIFMLLLVSSMLIHRPAYNLSSIHSVIYFAPIYMLGIIVSINKKSIVNYIQNKSLILGVLTLLISIIQTISHDGYGNFHKERMISYNGIDTMIIQKIFMIFFFLSFLQKIDNKEIPFLKHIASASFAIYFLHPWVLLFTDYFPVSQYLPFIPEFIFFIIKTLSVVGISLAVATLFKAILRKRSRYIIGW